MLLYEYVHEYKQIHGEDVSDPEVSYLCEPCQDGARFAEVRGIVQRTFDEPCIEAAQGACASCHAKETARVRDNWAHW